MDMSVDTLQRGRIVEKTTSSRSAKETKTTKLEKITVEKELSVKEKLEIPKENSGPLRIVLVTPPCFLSTALT